MLEGADSALPARAAALARFASALTARPWALTRATVDDLTAHGLDAEAVEAATGVTAMFNYFTRVADASGIEFDYDTPLPRFHIDRDRDPTLRPLHRTWPVVPDEHRTFRHFPTLDTAWNRWYDYLFNPPPRHPLDQRSRLVLARAAAEECCDRHRADALAAHTPDTPTETALDAFARTLSRTPWQMTPDHLATLRTHGLPEPAILHAISVIAHQNAESRLALSRAPFLG